MAYEWNQEGSGGPQTPGWLQAVSLVEQVSKVLSVMGQEEAGESLGAPMIPIQLPQGIVSSTSQVKLLSQYLP